MPLTGREDGGSNGEMMDWKRFFESGAAARVSAVWAALAVGLGAFGAHGLKTVLQQRPEGTEIWKTAVFYHLVHAVVMWVIGLQAGRAKRTAWFLMLAGTLGFSGSLYGLSTLGWRFLGPVTPVGGGLLLAGWICLALSPGRSSE